MNKLAFILFFAAAFGVGSYWLMSKKLAVSAEEKREVKLDSYSTSMHTTRSQIESAFKESENGEQFTLSNIAAEAPLQDANGLDLVPDEQPNNQPVLDADEMVYTIGYSEEQNVGPVLDADEMVYTIEDSEEQNIGEYIEIEIP
tara:strand:- start:15 stop:446 length:432 start_codon:yes stop_codon:yes gene_type:complete